MKHPMLECVPEIEESGECHTPLFGNKWPQSGGLS